MTARRQTTLRETVTLSGYGVHTAAATTLVLRPASINHGVVFVRKGLSDGVRRRIPARYGNVSMTELCTVLGEPEMGAVSTVEHVMAALYGLGVDNVLIEIDGPEVPILDGSARSFVDAVRRAGLATQHAARKAVRVKRPVRATRGKAVSELMPADSGFRLDVTVDFDSPVIGLQRFVMDLDSERFVDDVAGARTFGFMRDVEQLWKSGFALGASLENTVAIGDDRVINPEGLRYEDEFVRHKVLDAIGDLALAGLPIIGEFRSYCGGHRLNIGVLREMFSDPANFEIVEERELVSQRRVSMAAAAFAPSLG